MVIAVNAVVNNVPREITAHGFLVVRRDDSNASLWYYGFYQDEDRAKDAALEIGNGIVLETIGK